MDDDSCVMKYIEIVPRDNNRNCSDSPDVNLSPFHIKVCDQLICFFLFLMYCFFCVLCVFLLLSALLLW